MEVSCAFSDRFIPAHTRPTCPRRDMPPLSGGVVGSVGGMSLTIGDMPPTSGDRAKTPHFWRSGGGNVRHRRLVPQWQVTRCHG